MKNSLIIVALAVALFQVYAEGNVYNGFVDPLDRFAAGSLEFNNGDIYGNGEVNRALRRLRSETKVDEKGNVFKGKFDDEGKLTKGKITLANGDVMEGEFKMSRSRSSTTLFSSKVPSILVMGTPWKITRVSLISFWVGGVMGRAKARSGTQRVVFSREPLEYFFIHTRTKQHFKE